MRVDDGSTFTVLDGTNPQATLLVMGRFFRAKKEETRGWKQLLLKSDSTYVMDLLRHRSSTVPWPYQNRWLRTLRILSGFEFMVSHIYREGNMVSDVLSKSHLSDCWWDEAPDFIIHHVGRDPSYVPFFRFTQR